MKDLIDIKIIQCNKYIIFLIFLGFTSDYA